MRLSVSDLPEPDRPNSATIPSPQKNSSPRSTVCVVLGNQTCARPRLATNDPVPKEQAPLPQSALASSRRGGRCRSTYPRSLVGYARDQVIDSGEEHSQNRGRVRLVISDH